MAKGQEGSIEDGGNARRPLEQEPVICYVSRTDPDAPVRYITPDVVRLFGYPQTDWISQHGFFVQRIHPADRSRVLAAYRQGRATDGMIDIEYRMLAKDGAEVWVRNVATIHAEDEFADTVHGVLLNITPQKQIEESLRTWDAGLHRLINASTRINAERTLSGVLHEVVESARTVIGCRYAALGILDASRTTLDNFVTAGLDEAVASRMGPLPTGKGVLGLLIRNPAPIRVADISTHPEASGLPANHPPMGSFLGVPIIGDDGPYGNLYFTEKDGGGEFTEEDEAIAVMFAANAAVAVRNARLDEESIRMLSDLQALQRTRDRFYAMVNHELRNALTAVHGWSELLERQAGDTPARAVTETVESAEYALQLLNDLLDLSQLDAEALSIHMEETDARRIAQDSAAQMEPVAAASNVELVVDCETEDTSCTTDERRVRQIILNLLSNAIRHSPNGAAVTLRVSVEDSETRIDVIDRGDGIGPQEIAIIFNAYARAETRAGGGTGLGLTLSRRLARILGGDLTVSSQLGRGAKFTLRLPRHRSRG